NFEPRLLAYGLESNANVQLKNYWIFEGGLNLARNRWDTVALRGGPALRVDPGAGGWATVVSDNRKRVWLNATIKGGADANGARRSLLRPLPRAVGQRIHGHGQQDRRRVPRRLQLREAGLRRAPGALDGGAQVGVPPRFDRVRDLEPRPD